MWVRNPTIALLICTRPGVCGPSAETAPLAPCAEIEPGPLEISSPTRICSGSASSGVGFLPVIARKQRSAIVHCPNRSSRGMPRSDPDWWCSPGIVAPTITP